MDNERNAKFASFFINEILPRQKKTGVTLDGDNVASLFSLMYDHAWPRHLVRKILDYWHGIPSKNSTLEEDLKVIVEMFNAQNAGVQIVEKPE